MKAKKPKKAIKVKELTETIQRVQADFENYKKFKPNIKPCKRKDIIKNLSFEIAKDRLSMKIKLKENIRFSDGHDVTVDDVKFSFELLILNGFITFLGLCTLLLLNLLKIFCLIIIG